MKGTTMKTTEIAKHHKIFRDIFSNIEELRTYTQELLTNSGYSSIDINAVWEQLEPIAWDLEYELSPIE